MNHSFVYILTTSNNTTLYIGVTNNLNRRIQEHKTNMIPGFTKKYNVHKLIYYETFGDIQLAIAREKQLKSWRREKKMRLIESINPTWKEIELG